MSGIRVTYSGMISFIVGIVSVFTGLVFTLIITRELSPEEFGTWSLVGGLTGYVLILEPIVSYWATREIARGKESGKTAFLSSNLFSGISLLAYIVIIIGFVNHVDVDQNILLFAAILIPVLFARHTLTAINLGHNPQTGEFGFLAFELTKIPVALLLIYFLQLGVYGAILTAFVASLVSIIIQLSRSSHKLKGKFQKETLKNWLKIFWLPTYPRVSELFLLSDIVIFTIIIGTVEDIAFWVAALGVASIVLHAGNISKALYPKLLEGGKIKLFQENFTQVLYFAFPLVSMSIIFSRPALFALNPLYEIAVPVVILLSLVMFLRTISNMFTRSLTGIEKVDLNDNATFKDYIKSKLFYLPTLTLIQRGSYLASLAIVLLLFGNSEEKINLIIYWAIVALVTQIPYTIYLFSLIRKEFLPKIDLKTISKYVASSIVVFGFVYLFMDNLLEYELSIFEFLPKFLVFVLTGGLAYVGITYVIDKRTKKLVHSIIKELQNRKIKNDD